MLFFIAGGGTLPGEVSAEEKPPCPSCGVTPAQDEPCIVCGRLLCRHCARDLGSIGRCCPHHGNIRLALDRKGDVELSPKPVRRGRAVPSLPGPQPHPAVATAFYRSKDDAENALRFIAALHGVFQVREVEFVRELGVLGASRFDVWRALGLLGSVA